MTQNQFTISPETIYSTMLEIDVPATLTSPEGRVYSWTDTEGWTSADGWELNVEPSDHDGTIDADSYIEEVAPA